MWWGRSSNRREAWFHTFYARSPFFFLNGKLDQNGMQLSCLDDSVTLACNLLNQCQSSLFKDLNTLRWQEQSPNSFQKRRGLGRCNVCVCVCGNKVVCSHQCSADQHWLLNMLSSQACEVIMTLVLSAAPRVRSISCFGTQNLTSNQKHFISSANQNAARSLYIVVTH